MKARRFLTFLGIAFALTLGLVLTHEPTLQAGVNNGPGAGTVSSAAMVGGHLIFTRADGTKLDAGTLPTTNFRITVGTPTSTTPGTDGDLMIDSNYIYTFLSGTWKKTVRANL